MLHTPKTIFAALALLLAAGASANISPNTYAETSASADGSATVTLHVLEADTTEQVPVNPTATADSYTEYTEDPEEAEDTNDANIGEEANIELGESDEGTESYDSDNSEDTDTNAASTDASAASAEGKDPSAPDTGVATNTASEDATTSNGFPLIPILLGVLVIVIIFKIIKDAHSGRLYRGPRRDSRLRISSLAHLNFRHERNHKINFIHFAGIATISGLAIFTCVFFMNSNSSEETEAATPSYPYTISLENGSNYDIYVKQGEFADASFAIKTTTNNPTGYTLAFAADSQTLKLDDTNKIETIAAPAAAADFADNTWGFSVDGKGKYTQVPNKRGARAVLRKAKAAYTSGNVAIVHFGFKAAENLPAGEYKTTISFAAETNQVTKKLTIANGTVATVTRVSDGSTLTNGKKIILGEELKVTNTADAAGITQTAKINNTTFSGSKTITVTDNTTVSTTDDSMHFLKNTYSSTRNSTNGDAILVKSQGKTWLVDTGHGGSDSQWLNGSKVAAYLKELGVRKLDYVLLTHMHSDHFGGVHYLAKKKFIDSNTTVYLRGCKATKDIVTDDGYNEKNPTKNTTTRAYDACNKIVGYLNDASANVIDFYNHESERSAIAKNGITFGNFKVNFFNIDKDNNTGKINYNRYRENLNSIGTKWTHTPSGKTAFLAADWEWGNEAAYASKIGKVDILKAGHHGAKTSNTYDFFSVLRPDTVIVTSVDVANSDGAPLRQEAAWAYTQQRGGSVYFTGTSTGDAVAINFASDGYSVKKGVKKNVVDDANTSSKNKKSYDGKVTYYSWQDAAAKQDLLGSDGIVQGWFYPASKTSAMSDNDYKAKIAKYYVHVYFSASSSGNILSMVNRKVGDYNYCFKDGSKGVTKNRYKKSCDKVNSTTDVIILEDRSNQEDVIVL